MSLSLLVYKSTITDQLDKDRVQEMSLVFKHRNRQRNITGLLLFDGEHFLQVLEGSSQSIGSLYEDIKLDSRHKKLVTVLHEPIFKRTFSDWGLAFISIGKDNQIELPTNHNGTNQPQYLSELESVDENRAAMIIDAFAKGLWRESYSIPADKLNDSVNSGLQLSDQLNKPKKEYPVNFAFQPIVNPVSKLVTSAEALIRGPDNSSPFEVLSKYSGTELYEFDLESKKYALEIASDLGLPCRISLNLLPMSLIVNPDAVEVLVSKAKDLHIPNEQIIVEITEEEIITNQEAFLQAIMKLKTSGINVAIDDFGAGYAGLSLLTEFHPDKVKIDRKLIQSIHTNGPKQAIVRAIVNCCHSLGISVIAEGVEEIAEINWLLQEGITKFQGFYFAKPKLNSFPIINWS
ncbi:diguanylate phosphodiesterase [Methylophaga sp.]|uniref:diguanylate phosphodiesterase n=1 Tax=Methylophaga sp. TaxID=2024840 RepID=UPI003F6A0175